MSIITKFAIGDAWALASGYAVDAQMRARDAGASNPAHTGGGCRRPLHRHRIAGGSGVNGEAGKGVEDSYSTEVSRPEKAA